MSLLEPMDDSQLDAIIEGLERIKSLEAEIARLRLTAAEREAVETAARIAGAAVRWLCSVEQQGDHDETKHADSTP